MTCCIFDRSLLISTKNTFCGTYICPIHVVSNTIIQTKTVQSHPGSKFMVPIDSARVVSYSTSIDTIIVSVTIFATFDAQFWRLWSRSVQGHTGSKYIAPTESPVMVSYLTSFECMSWYLIRNSSNVKRSCCQSICDLHCVQHCIAHDIWDIWCESSVT